MNDQKMKLKTLCFEYIVYQLLAWYTELYSTYVNYTSFTRLKVLKLLFFVSTIHDTENSDLLDIFDNYWAMQHGPVESDIYNMIIQDCLYYCDFKSRQVNININTTSDSSYFNSLGELKDRVDKAIKLLRNENNEIVKYSAFELVEISHKWNSWKLSMRIAELSEKGSEPMGTQDIRNNIQYYSL